MWRTHLWCITVYFCSGPRPNVKEHAFKDLLGDQGFVSGKDKAPRTLKEMKHEVDIEGALDPVTAQVTVCVCVCSGNCVCVCVCVLVTVCVCSGNCVCSVAYGDNGTCTYVILMLLQIKVWAESKEYNIRALLCSLDTVLWEGESKWEPVEMNQLLHQGQVKKYFRKACLSVHPDKVCTVRGVWGIGGEGCGGVGERGGGSGGEGWGEWGREVRGEGGRRVWGRVGEGCRRGWERVRERVRERVWGARSV